MRRGKAARLGFTLLELLIVLLLLALIAGFALPAWFEHGTLTLDNAAKLLAADLRSAQTRAGYLSTGMRVDFDADGQGYRILEGRSEPAALVLERRWDRDAVFEGVHLVRLVPSGPIELPSDARTAAPGLYNIVLGFKDQARTLQFEVVERELRILDDGSR